MCQYRELRAARSLLREKTWVIFHLDDTFYDHRHADTAAMRAVFYQIQADRRVAFEELAASWEFLTAAPVQYTPALHCESADAWQTRHFSLLLGAFGCPEDRAYISRLIRQYFNEYMASLFPRPGIIEVIELLKAQQRNIAVLSRYVTDRPYSILTSLGIRGTEPPKIDKVFLESNYGLLGKPMKEMFKMVLQHMDVKPEDALYIGDEGVVAARQCGITAVTVDGTLPDNSFVEMRVGSAVSIRVQNLKALKQFVIT